MPFVSRLEVEAHLAMVYRLIGLPEILLQLSFGWSTLSVDGGVIYVVRLACQNWSLNTYWLDLTLET